MIESLVQDPYRRWLVSPLARVLKPYLSANTVTFISGLLGCSVVIAILLDQILLAVLLLLLSGYCDSLDGELARMQTPTASGAVFDILVDRFVEFSVILGLWIIDPSRALICLGMLGSVLVCVTSFLVVGVFSQNTSHKSFYYSPGLMERAEAFVFFIIMLLLPRAFSVLGIIFIILVTFTTLKRVLEFHRQQ